MSAQYRYSHQEAALIRVMVTNAHPMTIAAAVTTEVEAKKDEMQEVEGVGT